MLMKRMLRWIDELIDVAPERRHPERIVPVQSVRKLYEFFLVARRANWLDTDFRLGAGQIRSISRPTRRNASRTESSCDSVCVAM
jgi:hypothetical protein